MMSIFNEDKYYSAASKLLGTKTIYHMTQLITCPGELTEPRSQDNWHKII